MRAEDIVATLGALERAARTSVSVLTGPARRLDEVLSIGSLENARSSVGEATRRREILGALEQAWSEDRLSRSA